mmetsp:Transcript_94609/g.115904  ORF Transcript_94609/g.115904 Transcript_94609/m.115904 type:complete len:298 (-) Transcript_94609:2124-3017(-)
MSLFKRAILRPFNYGLLSPLNTFHRNSSSLTQKCGIHAEYGNILVSKPENGVSIITLNRERALNALCAELLNELVTALEIYETDPDTHCIVITGSGTKAFCAGADIKEMELKTYMDVYQSKMFGVCDKIMNDIKKPIIAAVNGFALGGGCELAMTCDIIIASEKAKFGQPEIKLGTIPGIGGTQRLTRAIGKSKAMELCLTGDMIDATKAYEWGLISRVVPHDDILIESIKLAEKISKMSQPIVSLTKECVNKAFETGLKDGIQYERMMFYSTFATKDQKEGMNAFTQKRDPIWNNE